MKKKENQLIQLNYMVLRSGRRINTTPYYIKRKIKKKKIFGFLNVLLSLSTISLIVSYQIYNFYKIIILMN